MKNLKSAVSVLLALILCAPLSLFAFAAAEDGSYVITNPYANVNWNTVKAYKAALHTHTGASDGDITLKQSIGRHAEHNFDIVATTDHGTVNYTWEKANVNPIIFNFCKLMKKNDGKLEYLSNSGTFDSGTSYTYATAENGDDYLTLDNGKKILRLPYGNEQNGISVNAHINSWFIDYTNNFVATYESTMRGIEKRGGVCVINHPGEYTKAKAEIRSENAYNENNFAYRYYINKFASLIKNNKSCIGLDVNSRSDSRTRFDRILWDILLRRFSANGENVYAVATSDAHNLYIINSGFSLLLMEELTSAAARKSIENGEFFPASHYLGNYDELVDIAAAIKEFYGETELYKKITSITNIMEERITGIESGKYKAKENIGVVYQCVDANSYDIYERDPSVASIEVNEATDEITINSNDALIVRWISNGKLLCTQKADEATFDLNDYADVLGDYVRAEVFGEGGVLYTQAFLLDAAKKAGKSNPVDFGYVNLGFFDFLLAEINNTLNVISRTLNKKFAH